MGLALNTNVASLTAQNNISATNSSLAKSLEKLSTGLKVNRGADGPAALVISEQQRAQISGLRTAIDNTNKGVSMVQTAEGALNEINRLLGKVRGLALDSANSGVNDASALAANQAEIDNALETINRIANTTKFGASKFLLNGQAGTLASVNGANNSNLGRLVAGTTATVGANQAVVVGASGGGSVTGSANMNTTTAPVGAVFTSSAAAAATPTFVNGDVATISGGGLTSPVTVDFFGIIGGAASTYAAVRTAIQGRLDAVAGAGKFAVTDSGGNLRITANDSNDAVTVASSVANVRTALGLGAASETSAAGTATLSVSGGGLPSAVSVDLSGVTDAATTQTAIQTALDRVAGAGMFTVASTAGGAALANGSPIIITSKYSSAAVTVQAGANAATWTGIASGSATTGAAGAAMTSATATNGTATGGRVVGQNNVTTGSLTANGSLTVNGGGLSAALVVDLTAGDTSANIVQKVQAALDGAGSIGGGVGKFIVSGNAGSGFSIQSNVIGSAGMTIFASSAGNLSTISGVSTTVGNNVSVAGNALRVFVGSNEAVVTAGSQGLGNSVSYGGVTGLSFNVGVSAGKTTSGSTNIDVVDNSLTFQIGANANETAKISIDKMTTDRLGSGISGLTNANTTDLARIKVTTTADAQDAIKVVDQAIADVSSLRGKLGAFQANTLESNATNLRATLENTTSAESVIRDTDFANEIAMFTKLQTQMQAGATVLGNANQLTTLVAGLLRS